MESQQKIIINRCCYVGKTENQSVKNPLPSNNFQPIRDKTVSFLDTSVFKKFYIKLNDFE